MCDATTVARAADPHIVEPLPSSHYQQRHATLRRRRSATYHDDGESAPRFVGRLPAHVWNDLEKHNAAAAAQDASPTFDGSVYYSTIM